MAEEIIGRRRELLALDAFLKTASAAGGAFLLEGDPGIGKTVLWREGLRLASELDFGVLLARSADSEVQIAFATIGDLLEPVLDQMLPLLVPFQRHALEAALLMREPEGPRPEVRVLGLALLSIVRALSQDRPLLIALDDMQWIDTSSADVLRFVLRRLEGARVGVVATVRGRPAEVPLELDRAFATFQRLPVEPLSLGAIYRLLSDRFGLSPPRPMLVRIHETAVGNPLFALELGRALVDGRIDAKSGHVPLPKSLRALVAQRLSALPARVRETLAAVAAAAVPSLTTLESLAPTTIADIELAEQEGVLELDGDRIRFTHPLLAPACYAALPLHSRRRLHERLAGLDVGSEERARHLALAVEPPDGVVANALEDASRKAFERGAVQGAASLGEQAVRFTPRDQLDELQRRRLAAAGYLARAGSKPHARQLLNDARTTAQSGTERARVALSFAWWGLATGSELVHMLENALKDAEGDVRLRAEIHAVLAATLSPQIDIRAAAEHASRAVVLANRAGDPAVLAHALLNGVSVDFSAGRGSDANRMARAIELEAAVPHPYGEVGVARHVEAIQLMQSGDLDAARRSFETLAAKGEARGDAGYADFLLGIARVEIRAGRWERAQAIADEAVEIDRDVGDVLGETLCHEALVQLASLRGDVARARNLAAEGLRLAETTGRRDTRATILGSLGMLELSLRNPVGARSCLDETARLVAAMGIGEPGIIPFVPDWVEALLGVSDLDAAEAAAAGLEERGRRLARGLALAGAARCRGLIAAARGELNEAVEILEAAFDQAERLGQPFESARTLLGLGSVRRAARHKRAARDALQQAAELFEQLGARRWLKYAHSELRRIGGRVASEGELSETERRIAELVVAGLRNREVAAELSLSPNTVAWNLSKVYRKLGVTSRTELAARIAARGLQ
jgi:DNA-binding CsgD family transcriptional regulator